MLRPTWREEHMNAAGEANALAEEEIIQGEQACARVCLRLIAYLPIYIHAHNIIVSCTYLLTGSLLNIGTLNIYSSLALTRI